MDTVVALATDLRAPALYSIIFAVVFAETAVLLGVVLPGETAAIVAGVLASQHQISLQFVIPLVVVAAAGGDSTGYGLGRFLGRRLLETRLLRRRKPQVEKAAATLRRRGGVIIVISRFLPFLRTVTPAAAGVSRMRYVAFAGASLAGCVLWGIGCPIVGYFAADSYHRVEEVVGPTGMALLAVILLGGWGVQVARRRRQPAVDPDAPDPDAPDPDAGASGKREASGESAVTDEPAANGELRVIAAEEPRLEPAELPPPSEGVRGRGGSGVVARPRRRIGPTRP
jgi:membrane-associated protein